MFVLCLYPYIYCIYFQVNFVYEFNCQATYFKSFEIAMPTTLLASSRPWISEFFFTRDESAHCSKDALQNDLEVIYEICKYGLI